jgi:hypothetical protein
VGPALIGDLLPSEQAAEVVGGVAALLRRLLKGQRLERGVVESLLELVSGSPESPCSVWGVGLDLYGVRSPVAYEILWRGCYLLGRGHRGDFSGMNCFGCWISAVGGSATAG